ncbi:uncharacterized protein N7459_003664 [Penicillium hispanicum]|uniref:uncharacterized protein n=1 Tax=Penicillium hispanicum TaxID=1080232 RepID=UPI002540FF11|nr:uncharacterized protein N7459_003664 [Penicillium hispanicum]KAJ5587899.1 hypothetical protein N7459_003664 [Penicillium hispanicum]
MSVERLSINRAAFAEAIQELPLSAVYGKVAELRNSVSHLHRSNDELRQFILQSTGSQDAEEENKELEGYIAENEGVITSMNERLSLLKMELENRGQPWVETEQENDKENEEQNTSTETTAPATNGTTGGASAHQHQSSDAGQDGENGVYL